MPIPNIISFIFAISIPPIFLIDKRVEFWNILKLYDKVRSDKYWNGKKPQGPAYHREQGFGLYKPD